MFSSRKAPGSPEVHHTPWPRCPMDLLLRHPVDLLAIECGSWQNPKPSAKGHRWEHLVATAPLRLRPWIVIEVWPPNSLLWDLGPTGKGTCVRWNLLGYTTKVKVVDSQRCGGAIDQPRALVVRDRSDRWEWADYSHLAPPRPMQNLLTPKGLRPRRKQHGPIPSITPLPSACADPMPSKPFAWIREGDEPRTLLPEETSRGLGSQRPGELIPRLSHRRSSSTPPACFTGNTSANVSSFWEQRSQWLPSPPLFHSGRNLLLPRIMMQLTGGLRT